MKRIKLLQENVERMKLAKEYWEQLKNIRSNKEINELIKEMKRNGFDLLNRYNDYDSRDFNFEEYDNEYLFLTFGRYGRATKIKIKNICKRFYIKESKN